MRLIVTSDWHLDASTGGLERWNDVAGAIALVAGEVTADDVFIFLGDLCDPDANRMPRCCAYAIGMHLVVEQKGARARWITGNHDVIEDGSGTSTLSPLHVLAPESVHVEPAVECIDGVFFIWLPYVARAKHYDAAAFIAGIEQIPEDAPVVVCGHLHVVGIVPSSETHEMGRGREHWMPTSAILSRWPRALILNGHYHAARVGEVCIPGSLARLTFGEEENRPGYLVITVGDRGDFEIKKHEVPSRKLYTVASVDEARELVTNGEASEAIVRVRPPPGSPPELGRQIVVVLGEEPAAMKVLPAPANATPMMAPGEPRPEPMASARAIVDGMVEPAAKAHGVDPDKLRSFVHATLERQTS